MTTVIHAEHLSKKYIIGHQRQERYTALRDVITRGARNFGRKILSPFANTQASTTEEFWALKDVSFEIKQGGAVGIIERNGAGNCLFVGLTPGFLVWQKMEILMFVKFLNDILKQEAGTGSWQIIKGIPL